MKRPEFETQEVIEQEATFDGRFRLPITCDLLMKIINHMAAECDEEVEEMDDPKRLIVRVIIQTLEK